jgi:hypothetical protein
MAGKNTTASRAKSFHDDALSLFDRENLEFLDSLRYNGPHIPAAEPTALAARAAERVRVEASEADAVFGRYRIDDNDEQWGMGQLNVRIVPRGRMRISRNEWRQVIPVCSDGFSEDGVRKDFHLNILEHPGTVRLIYISYRYKQSGDKQRECRRGILVDKETNIQELMTRLAYWFIAQPHAEENFGVLKALFDEAMRRLRGPGVQ